MIAKSCMQIEQNVVYVYAVQVSGTLKTVGARLLKKSFKNRFSADIHLVYGVERYLGKLK